MGKKGCTETRFSIFFLPACLGAAKHAKTNAKTRVGGLPPSRPRVPDPLACPIIIVIIISSILILIIIIIVIVIVTVIVIVIAIAIAIIIIVVVVIIVIIIIVIIVIVVVVVVVVVVAVVDLHDLVLLLQSYYHAKSGGCSFKIDRVMAILAWLKFW